MFVFLVYFFFNNQRLPFVFYLSLSHLSLALLSLHPTTKTAFALRQQWGYWGFPYLKGWSNVSSPCGTGSSWEGVSCESGRVVAVSLPDRDLGGSLSPSLAALTAVKSLNLSSNRVGGSLPSSWGNGKGSFDALASLSLTNNTLIGERGITLSGGQRQRVALARAILKRPPLLILDDALSAVDAETESLILNALRDRRGRATTLVIAHRLSTLAQADRVIVLDHGRIIQTGTHAELSSQEGLYRRLWQIQTSVESDFKNELKPA